MTTGQSVDVQWLPTSNAEPDRAPGTSAFDGGEGAWIDARRLFFTTKGDRRVWELNLDSQELALLHDCVATPDTPLNDVDNIVTNPTTCTMAKTMSTCDCAPCARPRTDLCRSALRFRLSARTRRRSPDQHFRPTVLACTSRHNGALTVGG